ncbi:unnamed protein product [Malus baccata var. baccata]
MSPDYGATMGFFPVDNVTLQYLELTGRSNKTVKVLHIAMIEAFLRANKMFVDYNEGICSQPRQERAYTSYLQLDLADVEPCVSGPKRYLLHFTYVFHEMRPLPLKDVKADWHACLDKKVGFKGFAVPKEEQGKVEKFSFHGQPAELRHGSFVIAAITSCTITSNPTVMVGAGLVAKKASELGLEVGFDFDMSFNLMPMVELQNLDAGRVQPWIKTSLAPGSRVVTEYLLQSGLLKYLNQLGFNVVGYGCTTCIGNSGEPDESVASAISENGIKNLNLRLKFHLFSDYYWKFKRNLRPLISPFRVLFSFFPPDFHCVVAFCRHCCCSCSIRSFNLVSYLTCSRARTKGNPLWNQLSVPSSTLYPWDMNSTYIHEPPYFKDMSKDPPGPHGVKEAYCLLNLGDSITTDHISPCGNIHKDSPASKYLLKVGVERKDFNSYGSGRGNDEVATRGTFANIRIVNKLLNGEVGPKTIHIPTGEKLDVYDAAMKYKAAEQSTIVLAGAGYGSGSARDWAAKGPMLQGVKALIAKSFERIHRSNLVAMGIIPLSFKPVEDADTLGLTGHERYTIELPRDISEIKPGQDVKVTTDNAKSFTCTLRFDTKGAFRSTSENRQFLVRRSSRGELVTRDVDKTEKIL